MPHSMLDVLEPRQLFAVLTAGQTVTTSLNTSTATQKNWTVSLKAGQAIVVAAGDTGTTTFAPELLLIGPDGKTVATSTGNAGAFLSKTAATGGTYTVRVRDYGQNQSGSLRVTAFYTGSSTVYDSDDATVAQSGRRTPATISPGDLDVWRINATRGQFVSVVGTENDVGNALDPGVILVSPAGTIVASRASETGVKIDAPSVQSGTYYAVVYESGADNTGRYGISFAQTPGPQYSGDPDTQSPLVSGKSRTGDLPGGDIDVFQVSVAKGRTIGLSLARTTGSLDPEILIIDPTGRAVATASGSTTASLNYTTLTGGTFSILIRDREADDGGMYRLTYTLR